jgi:SAM-dependent methyltransferase
MNYLRERLPIPWATMFGFKMKSHPAIDREFTYASPFLKEVIKQYGDDFADKRCLDVPCGNGRNTFLLAGCFKAVTAIDVNKDYLKAIDGHIPEYGMVGVITTGQSDILINPIRNIGDYWLICNIHFFNISLIKKLLKAMHKDALLLIETPGCHGRNYEILPTRHELDALFTGYQILQYDFKVCKHTDNTDQRGALKLLLRK